MLPRMNDPLSPNPSPARGEGKKLLLTDPFPSSPSLAWWEGKKAESGAS